MKKILLLLLCCALMLSTIACSQTQPETTEAPTDTTTEATNPVEETTEATEPEETSPVTNLGDRINTPIVAAPKNTTKFITGSSLEDYPAEGRKLSDEEMKSLKDLVEFAYGDPVWYNMATTCLFDTTLHVDLNSLLCAMPREKRDFTEDESKFLKSIGFPTGRETYDLINASVVDDVLQRYFGITIDNFRLQELRFSAYWDETDCIYHINSYRGRGLPTIKTIYQREGGFYDIYYTVEYTFTTSEYNLFYTEEGSPMNADEMVNILGFCLTLKETDTDYQVVSNVRIMHGTGDETGNETDGETLLDLTEFFTPQGTPLSEEEIVPFRELVELPGDRIYNLATASLFDRPEDINLDILFCGITPRYELTKAEEEFLMQTRFKEYLPAYVKATGGNFAMDTFCFEASVIDDVLQQYFGITFEEWNKRELSAIYWEESNCYYVQRSDTEQGYAIVQAVYERKDGYYDIYYLSGDFGFMYDNSGIPLEKEELNDIVCYCLTMKATDDGYLIVSNTPVYLVK